MLLANVVLPLHIGSNVVDRVQIKAIPVPLQLGQAYVVVRGPLVRQSDQVLYKEKSGLIVLLLRLGSKGILQAL